MTRNWCYTSTLVWLFHLSMMVYKKITMIYTQSQAWQCWMYATLNCLQKMGVEITEKEMLSFPSVFWFPDIERTYSKRGLFSSLSYVIAPRRIDNYLKEWKPLICLIYGNNFNSVRNYPFVQDFKGKMNHFVCLIEDLGYMYKYVDQQGEKFGDKWHGYILKDQMKWKIKVARIIL